MLRWLLLFIEVGLSSSPAKYYHHSCDLKVQCFSKATELIPKADLILFWTSRCSTLSDWETFHSRNYLDPLKCYHLVPGAQLTYSAKSPFAFKHHMEIKRFVSTTADLQRYLELTKSVLQDLVWRHAAGSSNRGSDSRGLKEDGGVLLFFLTFWYMFYMFRSCTELAGKYSLF